MRVLRVVMPVFVAGVFALLAATAWAASVTRRSESGIRAATVAGGQIAGTVTDASTHAPIQNIEVDVYGSSGTDVASTCTAVDGTYTASGIAAGVYQVRFTTPVLGSGACAGNADYQAQSYPHPVTVTDGSTTSGIDAAMVVGGEITGTVSGRSGGVEVDLYDSSGQQVGLTCGVDGTYEFAGLPTGSYDVYLTIDFEGPCGPAACFEIVSGPTNPVSVTAGETTSADFVLGGCHSPVMGTVTDAATGQPVAGATVTGYDTSGDVLASATTNSTAAYTLSIPPGDLMVKVGFSAGPDYISQFYDDKPSLTSADLIPFGCYKTGLCVAVGIDAALVEAPGQITGSVTDAGSHAPIQGATVNVYDASGNVAGSATTDSAGAYTVSGLAPGFYRVGFAAPGHVSQFYNAGSSLAGADPVTVSADSTTSGIDAALAPNQAPPPTLARPPTPTVTHLSETHQRFRTGHELATFARKRVPVGTTFGFVVNTASTVELSFTRSLKGRKVRGRCVIQTKGNKHKHSCKRTHALGSLNYISSAGEHTVQFGGRISPSKTLKPGHYKLVILATDAAGRSQPLSIGFTIVPAPRTP